MALLTHDEILRLRYSEKEIVEINKESARITDRRRENRRWKAQHDELGLKVLRNQTAKKTKSLRPRLTEISK